MNRINKTIINAVIEKAEQICPDSIALIGIYGSYATGDVYEKSDLDLLILTKNTDGMKLCESFILGDNKIGYDIYCTTWDSLQYDSECHHAHLSKLMDAKIVHVKDQKTFVELMQLREATKKFLCSEQRFDRVAELIERAKISLANSYLCDEIGTVRIHAFEVIMSLSDAIMIYHGTYFKRGVKRIFEELSQFPVDEFITSMKQIPQSKDINELRELVLKEIRYVQSYISCESIKLATQKDTISGTYEEMYSNWRNKVEEAAANHDTFSSFVNMCSFQKMLSEISAQVDIGRFDVMKTYDPEHLEENLRSFDQVLDELENLYRTAGITVNRYPDVDTFYTAYMADSAGK